MSVELIILGVSFVVLVAALIHFLATLLRSASRHRTPAYPPGGSLSGSARLGSTSDTDLQGLRVDVPEYAPSAVLHTPVVVGEWQPASPFAPVVADASAPQQPLIAVPEAGLPVLPLVPPPAAVPLAAVLPAAPALSEEEAFSAEIAALLPTTEFTPVAAAPMPPAKPDISATVPDAATFDFDLTGPEFATPVVPLTEPEPVPVPVVAAPPESPAVVEAPPVPVAVVVAPAQPELVPVAVVVAPPEPVAVVEASPAPVPVVEAPAASPAKPVPVERPVPLAPLQTETASADETATAPTEDEWTSLLREQQGLASLATQPARPVAAQPAPPSAPRPAASAPSVPSAPAERDVSRPVAAASGPRPGSTRPVVRVAGAPAPPEATAGDSGEVARSSRRPGNIPELVMQAPVEMWFGDHRVGVKAGTATYDRFRKYADVLLDELKTSATH